MLARIRRSIDENDEGFTLIELLVVIIIIGILAAIAIPVFLNQRKKGYQAGMKSDLRTVADNMETYFTDAQSYSTISDFPVGQSVTAPSDTINAQSISLSAGDSIKLVQAGVNGYCLQVTNTTKASGVTYVYNSLAGGLQPSSVTACPTSSTGF